MRPLTRNGVQALFDLADDHVDFARLSTRKGWLMLFRDATLFKVMCGVVRIVVAGAMIALGTLLAR